MVSRCLPHPARAGRILATVILALGLKALAAPPAASDELKTLVAQLDLEKYKATIKHLTQFGDRRQGTARNRAALDWIEAQLKSYGYVTERLKYDYFPTDPRKPSGPVVASDRAQGGGRIRGQKAPTGVNENPLLQGDERLRALNTEATTPGPGRKFSAPRSGPPTRRRCT
jgi:hypothetical protein